MKYNFITIEREYGSGGTRIAHRLAEECGMPCYGKDILNKVSEKYHVSIEKLINYEETVTNSLLYSLYVMTHFQSGKYDEVPANEKLYLAEQAVIRELASEGPAVFLGHCASEALRQRKGVLNVFIRAGEEEKKARIMTDYNIPEADVAARARSFDKRRANYYYANTAKKWDDLRNYDIVLDSGALGINGCVKVLKSLVQ